MLMLQILMYVASIAFLWVMANSLRYGLRTGEFQQPGGDPIRRGERPLIYWSLVVMYFSLMILIPFSALEFFIQKVAVLF